MTRRIDGVVRGAPIVLYVDGREIAANSGETIAAALLAAGVIRFRDDTRGQARGLYCNMGTCSECFVTVRTAGNGPARRLRGCLVPVADGLQIETGAKASE